MTAQIPEMLLHRGRRLALMEEPLYDYLRRIRRSRRPQFAAESTAHWRGYIGTWEIRDGMLTLVDFLGNLRRGEEVVHADLRTAFPWATDGVLPATWVTGELRCAEGRLVSYRHAGFASGYERDRIFTFEEGRLVSEFLILNPPDPVIYRILEDGGRICMDGSFLHAYEIDDPLAGEPFEKVYETVWAKRPGDALDDDDESIFDVPFPDIEDPTLAELIWRRGRVWEAAQTILR